MAGTIHKENMKKYVFNTLKNDKKHDIESLVKWCKEMKNLHPHYDTIALMIWAYEAGVVGYRFQDGKKG
jgi:hypothetical protein